jgi:hypothetical protein
MKVNTARLKVQPYHAALALGPLELGLKQRSPRLPQPPCSRAVTVSARFTKHTQRHAEACYASYNPPHQKSNQYSPPGQDQSNLM